MLIEEIILNNPSKESITVEIIQIGMSNWNHSKEKIENINGFEFTLSSGIIDFLIDNKQKHLCIAIGTTRLPTQIKLKENKSNCIQRKPNLFNIISNLNKIIYKIFLVYISF